MKGHRDTLESGEDRVSQRLSMDVPGPSDSYTLDLNFILLSRLTQDTTELLFQTIKFLTFIRSSFLYMSCVS